MKEIHNSHVRLDLRENYIPGLDIAHLSAMFKKPSTSD